MNNKNLQYYAAAAAMIFGIGIYQLMHISGMTMYPDEFGYWANAAEWLGFDWSEVVSLQSYYSFGYSILLWPFLACTRNPMLMYKSAVVLNIIIVYLHAVMLYQVTKELQEKEKQPHWLFCLMAACYPSLLFYMQFTLTESLLNFLFIVSIWALVKYSKTLKIGYGILFIVILTYSYFVHMRTVGILIAGILSVIVSVLCGAATKQQRKRLLVVLAIIVVCGLVLIFCGNGIKEGLQTNLYQNSDPQYLKVNDYGGQVGKIKALFTIGGMRDFLVSCVGKLFYLGVATFGTFYFGIWYLVKQVRKHPACFYIVMAVIFTFGITAVFLMYGGRTDSYLYGRYNEIFVPIVVYFGLYEMTKSRLLGRLALLITVLHGGMTVLLVHAMAEANPRNYQGYFTVGFSYVLKERMLNVSDYVIYPYIAGSIVMLLLILVAGIFIRKKKLLVWYLALFVGLYGYTAASAGGKYLYDHSIDTADDMALAETVKEHLDQEDTVLFLLSNSDAHYMDILQFCLREHPLQVLSENSVEFGENNIENKADFVFTYKNSVQKEILKELYTNEKETYHFNLYFD